MRIEVFEQEEGLTGEREVWVRALSNSVVDLADIKRNATEEQKLLLAGAEDKPSRYYPHLMTTEEKAETGYSLEDWWIFRPKKGIE